MCCSFRRISKLLCNKRRALQAVIGVYTGNNAALYGLPIRDVLEMGLNWLMSIHNPDRQDDGTAGYIADGLTGFLALGFLYATYNSNFKVTEDYLIRNSSIDSQFTERLTEDALIDPESATPLPQLLPPKRNFCSRVASWTGATAKAIASGYSWWKFADKYVGRGFAIGSTIVSAPCDLLAQIAFLSLEPNPAPVEVDTPGSLQNRRQVVS